MQLRPLGVGSQTLTHGNLVAGFYGEVSGIITANELRERVGVSQGTAIQTGDITWLKFSSNYKTLYIAKQPIQRSVTWDYLQSLDLVFGKLLEIGNYGYLLRLIQGSNSNPRSGYTHSGCNNEWENLIVPLVRDWGVYTLKDIIPYSDGGRTWSQEVWSTVSDRCVAGISTNIANYGNVNSNDNSVLHGWRPVLELLYKI